jgi:hypothetical protein
MRNISALYKPASTPAIKLAETGADLVEIGRKPATTDLSASLHWWQMRADHSPDALADKLGAGRSLIRLASSMPLPPPPPEASRVN